MVKVALVVIAIVAAIGGGLYYYTSQNSQISNTPVSQKVVNKVATVTPTPTSAPLITTDESIDTDVTALEKDLAGLEKSEPALSQDVNGL